MFANAQLMDFTEEKYNDGEFIVLLWLCMDGKICYYM